MNVNVKVTVKVTACECESNPKWHLAVKELTFFRGVKIRFCQAYRTAHYQIDVFFGFDPDGFRQFVLFRINTMFCDIKEHCT